ncbi:MAG: DnaJ domain-containing protein [Myxococcota bacterium]
MNDVPKPRAEGDLSKTPFAHLLLYVLRKQLSGTLAIWPEQLRTATEGPAPKGQDRVRFLHGVPVAAKLIEPRAQLDTSLLPLCRRQQAPYAFYKEDYVGAGEGVVEGRVDPYVVVAAASRGPLRDLIIERVLAGLHDAPLGTTNKELLDRLQLNQRELRFVEYIRSSHRTPTQLIAGWEDSKLARRLMYLLAICHCIEPLTQAGPDSRTSQASRAMDSSQHGASHKPGSKTPGRLSHPSAARDPSQRAGDPSQRAARGAVKGTREKQAGPPGDRKGATQPPQAPKNLSQDLQTRWRRITAKVQDMDEQNYFQMLSLDTTANAADVEQAYLTQVKEWHPDRLPEELKELRPWADQIFHHMTEAKNHLTDEETRRKHIDAVRDGGGTPKAERQIQAVVGAAMEFQKVEVLVRRREWQEALDTLNTALEMNNEDPDMHAMLGFILYQLNPEDREVQRNSTLEALNHALEINPDCEQALYTKGLVLKRTGDKPAAIKLFKKVIARNPRHIEAVREVRLATMRGETKLSGRPTGRPSATPSKRPDGKHSGRPSRSSATTSASGGFLSKLFGGKKS